MLLPYMLLQDGDWKCCSNSDRWRECTTTCTRIAHVEDTLAAPQTAYTEDQQRVYHCNCQDGDCQNCKARLASLADQQALVDKRLAELNQRYIEVLQEVTELEAMQRRQQARDMDKRLNVQPPQPGEGQPWLCHRTS